MSICNAQDEHHEIITMLHTDQMMGNGYGYPPRVRIDSRDRHVFSTRLVVLNPNQIEVRNRQFTITFNIEVYLDANALSTKMFSNFTSERFHLFNDQAVRIPLNRILSKANRLGCFVAESPELMRSIVDLGSFDMGMVGSFFPPVDVLITRALIDVEENTQSQESPEGDVELHPALLSHQRNNVRWMLRREREQVGANLWFPFTNMWTDGENGPTTTLVEYCPCMQIFRIAPQTPQVRFGGGMLLDDTGLGKTRSILGLCAATPGTSLVVVPLSVLSQWKKEATDLQMNVYAYYGQTRIRDIEKLSQFAVIVTTFTIISRDFNTLEKHRLSIDQNHAESGAPAAADPRVVSIFGMPFSRIIVDESHKMCANTRNALEMINTQARWCATATPGNQPTTLVRQLSFLNLPIPTTPAWIYQNLLIGNRLHSRLGYLLKSISRRHNQNQIEHPCGNILRYHKHFVELSDNDSSQYAALLMRKRITISSVSYHPAHALLHFNQLRSHMSSASFNDISFSQLPPMHSQPEPILERIRNDQCAICLDPFDAPVLTPCQHNFCLRCMRTSMGSRLTCPLCRQHIEWTSLQLLSAPIDETVAVNSKLFAIVHKIASLTEKVLVFSEFQSTLRILKQLLDGEGVRSFVIEGRMSRYARDRNLGQFEAYEGQGAFLLNLKTAGTGLNLQSAKTIIFCEPLISETLRNQAIGRIRRIGQVSEVIDVHMFMLQNTLEVDIATALEENTSWHPTTQNIRRLFQAARA
jgi:SNF2 family DNA or RNA helicase